MNICLPKTAKEPRPAQAPCPLPRGPSGTHVGDAVSLAPLLVGCLQLLLQSLPLLLQVAQLPADSLNAPTQSVVLCVLGEVF